MRMRFVWDPAKAESNHRKHGIRFEEAVRVFFDPLHLTVQDRVEGGEYRWQTTGQVGVPPSWSWPTPSPRAAPSLSRPSALSPLAAPPRRKGSDMPMVEYTLDTLPELTEERRKELARLDALPADQIDTSDIPELTDEQWAGAVRGRFYRPIKQQITARLDADVLAWLKAGGQGYQTRMNAILRRAMMAELDRRA